MRANPGGQIPPDEVVGRDRLIGRLWQILERQSVVLSAERRMGKTCVIQKMRSEVPPRTIAIYRDLEGVRTSAELAESVLEDVHQFLGVEVTIDDQRLPAL